MWLSWEIIKWMSRPGDSGFRDKGGQVNRFPAAFELEQIM
jgi:hypothetical protein